MKGPSKRSLRGPAPKDAAVSLGGANDNDLEQDERSVTVAMAASHLGCDASTVRELLRKGLLTGHRVGKSEPPKGVRVKMWSIREYEARHPVRVDQQPPAHSAFVPVCRARNKADEDAHARLKALGA